MTSLPVRHLPVTFLPVMSFPDRAASGSSTWNATWTMPIYYYPGYSGIDVAQSLIVCVVTPRYNWKIVERALYVP
jgi:hypothetical protein